MPRVSDAGGAPGADDAGAGPVDTGAQGTRTTPPAGPHGPYADGRARFGALLVFAAVALFALTVVVTLSTSRTAYVWHENMVSDLGDDTCRVRGGRWICSPNHALFNTGVSSTGVLFVAAGACLRAQWGRVLAGGVVVMGVGLVATGVFPAGSDPGLHLTAVVLALVVPALGFLVSGIRPGTPWLERCRGVRVVLASIALVFAAVSRLPGGGVPRGAGELVIVGALLLVLLLEAGRLLLRKPRRPGTAALSR